MPFGLQPIHLIAVAIVALLIFGPSKLPELGRSIGKTLTEFRKGAKDMTGSFMEEINQPIEEPSDQGSSQRIAPPPPVPQPFFSQPLASTAQSVAPNGAKAIDFEDIRPVEKNYTSPVEEKSAAPGNFCIHCGKSNPAEAVYCNGCGSKIAA